MNTSSTESVSYAAPASQNHPALRAMARSSFSETFSQHYEQEPFRAFLDHTYGPGGSMDCDLVDPTVRWRMGICRSQPIGYAKVVPLRAPAPDPMPGALELQQIYVLREWQGEGVASQLMEWALGVAATAHAPEIYLTVFDHNRRAKRFYTRYGFTEVGRCTFRLGDRVDDDRIWMRTLP